MYFPQSEKQTNNINCQDISDNGSDVRNARTPTEAFRFPRGPACMGFWLRSKRTFFKLICRASFNQDNFCQKQKDNQRFHSNLNYIYSEI